MGRRLALLIATYEYQDAGLRRLTSPAHDAEALAGVLGDPEIAGFEVTILVNESRDTVGAAIKELYRDRRADDLTLLYFTGHGLKDDDGQLYLAMADTQRDNLAFTALSTEAIDRTMAPCVSRQKVLILDCCYSGAYRIDLAKADTGVQTLERFRGRGRGLTVLTASDAVQYSFEGDTPSGEAARSVFTRHLVAGIRDGGADLDGDGDITLDELYSYVHDRVVADSPQRPKMKTNVEGRTLLAHNVRWQLPTHLTSMISNPMTPVRLHAFDLLDRLHHSGNVLVRAQVLAEFRRLADDDSRAVSAAAAERLVAITGHRPAQGPGTGGATRTEAEILRQAQATATEIIASTKSRADAIIAETVSRSNALMDSARRELDELRASTLASADAQAAADRARSAELLREAEENADRVFASARTAAAETLEKAGQRAAAIISAAEAKAEAKRQERVEAMRLRLDSGGAEEPGGLVAPTPTLRSLAILAGHDKTIYDLAFHQGSTLLASASQDCGVLLWDPNQKDPVDRLDHDSPVYAVAFHPDRTLLATAGQEGGIRLWNVKTSQRVGPVLNGHRKAVFALAFHPSEDLLVSASLDGTAMMWNPRTGQPVGRTLTGHTGPIYDVAFQPQGNLLATASADHGVRLWNARTGEAVSRSLKGHTGAVLSVAFHPDGSLLATAGADSRVIFWDSEDGLRVGGGITVGGSTVESVAFHRGGDLLAAGSFDGAVSLWDVRSAELVGGAQLGVESPVHAVVFHPTKDILASGGTDGRIGLWSGPFLTPKP